MWEVQEITQIKQRGGPGGREISGDFILTFILIIILLFLEMKKKKWNEELAPSLLGSKEEVKPDGVEKRLWIHGMTYKSYCFPTGSAEAWEMVLPPQEYAVLIVNS